MSAPTRSLLIFSAVFALVFGAFFGWYHHFFAPATPPLPPELQQQLPQLKASLHNKRYSALENQLTRLPFAAAILSPEGVILASNLPDDTVARKQQATRRALQTQALNQHLKLPEQVQLHFQQAQSPWDPVLWFPLIFSLLLASALALREYFQPSEPDDPLQNIHILTRAAPDSEEQEALRREQLRLQARLNALQKQLEATEKALEQSRRQVYQLQNRPLPSVDPASEKALQSARNELQRLQTRIQSYEQGEARWQEQAQQWQTEHKELRQQWQQLKQELNNNRETLLQTEITAAQYQQTAETRARQLQHLQERLQELEVLNRQHFETLQELERLKHAERVLMRREELWLKDKQKLIASLSEREQQLEQLRKSLASNRQKLRELSVAYKKQLELGFNWPEDLVEARNLLDHLIAEKDTIERENAHLQVELGDQRSTINRLRKELETRALQVQESERQQAEMEGELKKLRLELELLGETLNDKLNDLERLQQVQTEHTLALQAATQERDTLKYQYQEQLQHHEELQTQHAALLFEKETLAEKLEKIDLPHYELQIEQLRQSVQLLSSQQQRKQQAIEQLKQKLQQGAELYERLKRHVEFKEREIRGLRETLERKTSIIQLLEQKLAGPDEGSP